MNDGRLHWDNTVQWARAKLVERGLLEPPDHRHPPRWRPTIAGVKEAQGIAARYSDNPAATYLGLDSRTEGTLLGEERIPVGAYEEGRAQQILVNAYERSAAARAACISYHGKACSVCGFDFEETFGRIGADFIHVHHLRPLSEIGAAYRVDPIHDLRSICANCHSIVHRRDPPYSLDEVRAAITNVKLKTS